MAILRALFHPSQGDTERLEVEITQSCLDVFVQLSYVKVMKRDTAEGE